MPRKINQSNDFTHWIYGKYYEYSFNQAELPSELHIIRRFLYLKASKNESEHSIFKQIAGEIIGKWNEINHVPLKSENIIIRDISKLLSIKKQNAFDNDRNKSRYVFQLSTYFVT